MGRPGSKGTSSKPKQPGAASSQGGESPAVSGSTSNEKLETVESEALDLDPHLQQIVHGGPLGRLVDQEVLTESADGTLAVDVLAKLKNPAQPVEGLHVVEANGQIITGTVEIDKIEAVRADPNVISLKRATKLNQELRFSVPEIRADAAMLQTVSSPNGLDGSGAIIGLVDYGCDFLHGNFRKADGTSRLLFLWDQRGGQTNSSPQPYNYGREYTAAQIDAAIQSTSARPSADDQIYARVKFPEDPNNRAYLTLGYAPEPSRVGARGTGNHGTHVMDIAAGNGRGSGVPGVAPGADLIFVHVAADDFGAEESFGNSRRLVEAVRYIFNKAQSLGRACVVNLSLGTHGGPHDGTTLVEQDFDQLMAQPGRAIVISAGNSWERRSHAAGRITPATPRTLTWQTGVRNTLGQLVDPTGNELEVWYPGAAALEVTLITPSGQQIGPTRLGRRTEIKVGGVVQGLIIHRQGDPLNGDNHLDILLGPTLPLGKWQVVLSAPDAEVAFHSWIERDDQGQSQFDAADDVRTHTLGSISCGKHTLTVGSYDARSAQKDLSPFTAEGPTRDGKQKPETSAPGHGVLAAWSLTHDRVTSMSGTSMAAPHVTGLVALIMQAAGRPLTIDELRQLVKDTARVMTNASWHARYGAGRIDTFEAIRKATAPAVVAAMPDQAVAVTPAASATTSPRSLDDLITALTQAAAEHRSRIRVEIEIQPIGS